MIKAILFDMDGILFDSEYYYMEGTKDQLQELGYTGPTEDLYSIIGITYEATFDYLAGLLDNRYSAKELMDKNDDYFLNKHPINFKEIMFPGLKEELDKLKEMGIRMTVCSSSSEELIDKCLNEMEIESYFEYKISSENVVRPKPHGDVYLSALKKLGLKKEECIVYEDSDLGIQAGKDAGIYTVARKDDRFGQKQNQADKIVKDIQELTNWIREENSHARSDEN